MQIVPAQPSVQVLPDGEAREGPAELATAMGFSGLEPWLQFLRRAYALATYQMVTKQDGDVTAMLALVHIKHPLFGSFLTTAPFASYGGFAAPSRKETDALLDQARALRLRLGADYTCVRFAEGEETPPEGWKQSPIYATYLVDLSEDPVSLLSTYSADHRNHIRKSLKKGFSIRFGQAELLDDVYEALAQSMHELGSPYHSKAYLRAMAEALGASLEFAVLYDRQHRLAGAGVFISLGDTATNLHANILRRYRRDYAGEFLYWSAVQHYGSRGFRILDLGRSLRGSGNETFKMKWRPRTRTLAYWYDLGPGMAVPAFNQKNARFHFAIQVWKHLPAFVVRPLGPYLIRGLA